MKSIRVAIRVFALSALLAGCAHLTADPFESPRRPIRFDIVNRNFNDASVWAVFRAERIRLGTVTGKTESSFQLPWRGADAVHMEIDLVGGERCVTESLMADEGDIFYLEIQLELSQMPECRSG
jgi:hypothetical protein